MSNKNNTRKLGKGLDALFGEHHNLSTSLSYANEPIAHLQIDHVFPNPNQPRRQFDQSSLDELAVSIKEFGILQPLVVVQLEQNKYSIVAGERRWRAAKLAQLKTVPAIVRTASELEMLEMALIENVQREDLSPLDQALSVERLHEQFSMSYEQIATKLGKAYSTVANIVRLLQLPSAMQQALRDKEISEGHARALLSLQKDTESQKELFYLIRNQHLSVRQAEQFVVGLRTARTPNNRKKDSLQRTATTNQQTKKLSKKLEAPVTIHYLAKGGKLSIRFYSDEEYERIITRLSEL